MVNDVRLEFSSPEEYNRFFSDFSISAEDIKVIGPETSKLLEEKYAVNLM